MVTCVLKYGRRKDSCTALERGASARRAQRPAATPALPGEAPAAGAARAPARGRRSKPGLPAVLCPESRVPSCRETGGEGARKPDRRAWGVIWPQGRQDPPSRLAPRSSRCSEQAPHFPASACSGAFFLFLKCPKPRESQEAYASSIAIILQERSGQGS